MRDPFLKRIEILFRRLLISLLAFVVKRNNIHPDKKDYNSSKFLFIRQDRIGDVLISTPIFASIKKHYPNAVLDVLLSPNNCFVLDNDPLIRNKWIYKKDIISLCKLIRSIRHEKYDYAIDMMDNPSVTATILCLLAGAKWNVGIEKNNSYVYDIIVPMLSRNNTHIVDRISQLLNAFNIDPAVEKLNVRYYTSQEADVFADKFVDENKLENRKLVGVNISAGGTSRFWGINNYHELLSNIVKNHPSFAVIVLFKPEDINNAKLIIESHNNVYLSPITTKFDCFAAMIKNLSILISPDTSAIHLASAFGIPSVVLYVQSDKTLRIWEPYNVENETIITDVDDLSLIPVNTVLAAFERLLKRIDLD